MPAFLQRSSLGRSHGAAVGSEPHCSNEISSSCQYVDFAKKYDILVCHDHAYSEVYFDPKNQPPSIFEAKGARDIAIEMFSLSKAYNMTGWRVGFVVGNEDAVQALSRVKKNIDSGVFKAIQRAAITGLSGDQ